MDKPPRLFLLTSHSLHKDETFDDDTGYIDNSDGSQGDWVWHWQTDNYNDVSHDWHDGTGGAGAMHKRDSTTGSGYYHVPITPWSSQAAIQISWPGSDWPTLLNGTATGDLAAFGRVCTPQGETGPPVIYQIQAGVSAGVNLNTWTHSFQPSWDLIDECFYWMDDRYYDHHSYSAQDSYQLQTGGRASSQRQNLFGLSIGISEPVVRSSVLVDDGSGAYIPGPANPIQPQTSKVDGQPVGSDGNQWRTYKDSDTRDVTPRVKNKDFYTFNIGQQKYKLVITTGDGTQLDPDMVVPGAKHVIGEKINLSTIFSPPLPEEPLKGPFRWALGGTYINAFTVWLNVFGVNTSYDNHEDYYDSALITGGLTNFRIDSSRLLNENIFAWWQTGSIADYEPETSSIAMGLTFKNGQYVIVSAKGLIGMHQPTVTWDPTYYRAGVVSGYKNSFGYLSVGIGQYYSNPVNGALRWAAKSEILESAKSSIDGTFSMIQLIQRSCDFESWTDWRLDNAAPYNATGTYNNPAGNPIGSFYSAGLTDSDAPAESTWSANTGTFCFASAYMTDHFQQFFVFKPDSSGSIWVTLGEANWNWHGAIVSDSSQQGWEWSGTPVFYHSQNIVPSTRLPEWINRKNNN